jgi:hypothetical protein
MSTPPPSTIPSPPIVIPLTLPDEIENLQICSTSPTPASASAPAPASAPAASASASAPASPHLFAIAKHLQTVQQQKQHLKQQLTRAKQIESALRHQRAIAKQELQQTLREDAVRARQWLEQQLVLFKSHLEGLYKMGCVDGTNCTFRISSSLEETNDSDNSDEDDSKSTKKTTEATATVTTTDILALPHLFLNNRSYCKRRIKLVIHHTTLCSVDFAALREPTKVSLYDLSTMTIIDRHITLNKKRKYWVVQLDVETVKVMRKQTKADRQARKTHQKQHQKHFCLLFHYDTKIEMYPFVNVTTPIDQVESRAHKQLCKIAQRKKRKVPSSRAPVPPAVYLSNE